MPRARPLSQPSGLQPLSEWDLGTPEGQGLGLQCAPCAACRYIESYTSCVVVQAFQKVTKRRR